MPRKSIAELETELSDVTSEIAEQQAEEVKAIKRVPMPGEIIRRGRTTLKNPWTVKDQEKVYGISTFTPEHTVPFTISGIRYQLFADIPITAPRILEMEYSKWKSKQRRVGHDLARMGVQRVGAGGIPPEE